MLTQHIPESLQVTPGPFPDFWVGSGYKATLHIYVATECLVFISAYLVSVNIGKKRTVGFGLGYCLVPWTVLQVASYPGNSLNKWPG